MAKSTKYVARYNGEIVGTRTTASRTYTHAVVAQWNEAESRAAAYGYKATETDRKNFNFYSFIAQQEPGKICTPPGWRMTTTFTAEEITKDKALVDGGFDAYAERQRQRNIEWFELRLSEGYFKPFVATWCGRLDLAQKEYSRRGAYALAIVPAEVA